MCGATRSDGDAVVWHGCLFWGSLRSGGLRPEKLQRQIVLTFIEKQTSLCMN